MAGKAGIRLKGVINRRKQFAPLLERILNRIIVE